MSTSTGFAWCAAIAEDDDLDGDVVALTRWRRGDVAEHGVREYLHPSAQLRVVALRPAGLPSPPPDALGAWGHADVDELDHEPDDLRLLARMRDLDDLELPDA
jgi:hypothetical protein